MAEPLMDLLALPAQHGGAIGAAADVSITVRCCFWPRNNKDWAKEGLERDEKFMVGHKPAEGGGEALVSGDSLIRDTEALELLFESRMFVLVEA